MNSRRNFLRSASAISAGGVIAAAVVHEAKADSFSSNSRIINIETLMQTSGQTATQAVQNAVNTLAAGAGGTIFFPPGQYNIASTITVATNKPIEIVGSGWSSIINWNFNGHLFNWPSQYSCREVTVRDLKIVSAAVAKSPNYFAINCDGVTERSCFHHIYFSYSFLVACGSAINLSGIADSTTISDCLIWGLQDGTGIRIGSGSQIIIEGGRIIGLGSQQGTSIGVHLTGGNGGVHINSTDIIALNQGVLIERLGTADSNREIFIAHATIDGCWRGLAIKDNSYISVIGCWAASCDHDNIHVESGYPSALLVISGGTIFNAGVADSSDPLGCNGLVVNSGSFQLTGVSVRNNLGKGIWVPNASVVDYTIGNCKIFSNGQGAYLRGSRFIISSNIFRGNTSANSIVGTNHVNVNNIVY